MLRTVSNYVISIIIADIMNKKFSLKISISVEILNVVSNFFKNFTPEITSHIKRIATEIIVMLPIQVNRKTMKQQIQDIYKDIVQENAAFFIFILLL